MFIANSSHSLRKTFQKTSAAPTPKTESKAPILAQDSFRPKDELTEPEREELDNWNNRLRQDLGQLRNPPTGDVDPEIAKAQGYLLDLVDELAGEELTERNLELKLEVFSGDVPQAALDDDMFQELVWKEEHPDTPWPLRAWMDISDGNTKPIYRMTVNLGLLKTLESKDELAFILAQQAEKLLDHDLRDPDNEETLAPNGKSYVNSGEMQADADRAAIARMSKAGFNPQGALKALNTLYKANPIDYPDNDLNRGLLAAAHGHEHEGMRLGLVQAEVERYIRRGDPTTAVDLTPLPQELKIEEHSGYEKPVANTGLYQAAHKRLIAKVATDKTPEWMFGDEEPPLELGAIALAQGTAQDKEDALLAATLDLGKSQDHTSQQKVDGFLRLLMALNARPLPEDKTMSEETQVGIQNFLAENGAAWDASKFYGSLLNEAKDQSLHNSFVSNIVFNESFQKLASQNLPGLVEGVPEAWVTSWSADAKNPEDITSLIQENHDGDRNSWALAKEIDTASLQYVSGIDAQAMAQESGEYGASKALTLTNELLSFKDAPADFQLKLRDSASALVDAAAGVRENKARLRLRPPYSEAKQLNGYLNLLGESENWKDFSPEFNQDLPVLLKDFATLTTTQPGLFYAEGIPAVYSEGLEQRMVGLLDGATPEEQKTVFNHLSRHLNQARRVRGRSPRREWLGQAATVLAQTETKDLVAQLSNPELSQHSDLLAKTLMEGYNLTVQDLPDTSTASLKALNERVQADEFAPQREDYQSDEAYDAAYEEYWERQSKIEEVVTPLAPLESRLVLGRMTLLGHNAEISQSVAQKLDPESFKQVLKGGEEALERHQTVTELGGWGEELDMGADAGAFVMDGLVAVQDKIESLETWHDLADRSISFSNGGLEARVGTKRKLGDNLFKRLEKLEAPELKEWLAKDRVMNLLSANQSSDLLLQVLGDGANPKAATAELAKAVKDLDETYELQEKYPVAYAGLRDKVSEKAQLQPSNFREVFPKEQRGVTDTNAVYTKQARALSGLLAMARERSPLEQLDTIEYLMGRQDVMPAYLEAAAEDQSFAPLNESLQTTRQDLLEADAQTRVMVANSFLAGPSSILRSEEGQEIVINHFLKNLEPKNRDFGRKIARAVLHSHGESDTLAVAFILGQKPEEPKEGEDPGKAGKLDEATILNRLFDAYGVPGIKMKQYLAFTSEFSDFKDAFESAQDSAMPLNYYQVLKLVQKRFGDKWPTDMKIDRVLGSGSVNVAIRYRNEETGKREVVSLGREDIVESTNYDFKKFHSFINELTSTPEDKEKFGYVLGLLNLIEGSVELEFEKENAKAVQQMAYKTYKHKVNGWTVKSIDAYRVEALGLFMEEAKGKTARKIYTRKPDVYAEAMEAMAAAEFGILKGQTAEGNLKPKPLFANPDIHDGQMLIDEDNKTVTVLDFGQAVPINNVDREAGLDILTIIGKADSAKAAAKRLNKRYFQGKTVFKPEDLTDTLKRTDRMDIFIHLLSDISRKGADVPLSTVHWVMGVNRQLALTEKIGKPIDKQVRNMVITHKLGLPLQFYNTAHAGKQKVARIAKAAVDTAVNVATTIVNTIGGWLGIPRDEEGPKQQQITAPTTPAKPIKRKRSEYVWRPDFSAIAQELPQHGSTPAKALSTAY